MIVLGGAGIGGGYWITQDKARCALVPDFVQPILCRHEVIESLAFKKGSFQGPLDVRFMSVKSSDGYAIEMVQLLKPFSYKDSKGHAWEVPEGFISDGASIPEPLWAVVGGPYSGPYRDAAVIHDYFCYTKNRRWQDTHDVFLEAALNRGTPKWKAEYMYAGILWKGPRWPKPNAKSAAHSRQLVYAQVVPGPTAPSTSTSPPSTVGKTDQQIFDDLRIWIETAKPTRDEIKKRVEEIRKTQTPVKR